MEIKNKAGETFNITIGAIPALDAQSIAKRYPTYLSSTDKYEAKAFLIEVLSYASITIPDVGHISLDNDKAINLYCGKWFDVQNIFDEVLRVNAIDVEEWREKVIAPWSNAGREFAVAFVSDMAKLITPAMEKIGAEVIKTADHKDGE
ncbi:hypothetical protein JX85_23635 [Salmonella enterica]|nr:hypothetical protein [Salmonella enterica]